MLAVGVSLTVGLLYVGVTRVLPRVASGGLARGALLALGVACVGNLLARYALAVLTNPGTDASVAYARALACRDPAALSAEEHAAADASVPPPLTTWSTCARTGLAKPPRAHFDAASRRLVLNYDHFCPWIFNSVGYQNLRHFFAFLVWVWVSCTYGALLSLRPALEVLGSRPPPGGSPDRVLIVLMFALCQLLSLVMAVMLSSQVHLTGSGMTAVDQLVLANRRLTFPDLPNPFDAGSVAENLRGALTSSGSSWWELLAPSWPSRAALPAGEPFPGAFTPWSREAGLAAGSTTGRGEEPRPGLSAKWG